MAKDKERSINPAQAQRKADKAKALKKARNEQQAKRNEKLARRNPDRIQRQIDDLKALEASGEIKAREKAILADLERDLKAIHKARESQGAPARNGQTHTSREERSVLGKRRHDGQRKPYHEQSSGSETDESVRNIPMPRDTPPPAPRRSNQPQRDRPAHDLPDRPAPVYESKTTYSSAPQLRDLKKEAVTRFVPDIVRRKTEAVRGQAGLLEPEEFDKLEKEGYYNSNSNEPGRPAPSKLESERQGNRDTTGSEADRLREEEARFQRELAETMDHNDDIDVSRQSDHGNHDHDTSAPASALDAKGPDQDEDESEDDEEDYLPPLMGGKGMFKNMPLPQTQHQQHPSSFSSTGAGTAASLFSKIPPPKSGDESVSKRVYMEEVDDEDA